MTCIIGKYYISLQNITNTKHTKLGVYSTPKVVADDELDRLKKIIFLFSSHRKASGEASNILREKLILLLALYLMFGYSPATKEKAAKILKVKKAAINSMNLELRQNDYLIKDMMNTRRNHLHPDLEILREYVMSRDEKPLLFLFTVTHES